MTNQIIDDKIKEKKILTESHILKLIENSDKDRKMGTLRTARQIS